MPFNNKMQLISEDVIQQFEALRDQEAELRVRLAETMEQKGRLWSAVERAQSLLKGDVELPQNPCISCYVFHEQLSSMNPVTDEIGVNKFRCHKCGDELRVAA
jgi:hypothetical protein